ncbi:hypothetical protein M422DRAFT_264400 [Sphaerobolus stellatus SS14]|uniref:Uncharacterized protein n=1 Tax=Sphaerobolus stellatus (strain SS14) TaxID=990650 RepID=A0A0C9TTI8_SPHS4|nr:hypothetical protein M422DRAFT_264400 [Sphaerobolus stellatus SS14]
MPADPGIVWHRRRASPPTKLPSHPRHSKTSRIIDELLGIMIYVAGLVASKTVSACGAGTADLGYDHGQLEYGRW